MEQGLDGLGLVLDRAAIANLYSYFVELRKWSAKVNLIARDSTDDQIIEAHFLDSLTLLPLLPEDNTHLLDIGTGAGFPGLVLKAVRPAMRVTLVEPRLKRVSFLKHVVRTLALTDATVLACRAEDEEVVAKDIAFSHVTSRAVTDIGGFLALVGRFALPGVEVICMKGPRWREELAGAAPTMAELAYVQRGCVSATLPFSGAERTLLVFRRELGGADG